MKKILLILSLFCVHLLFPQSQASNWYFGYGAGLQFNLGQNSVNSVNDGRLVTNEGCATISDKTGNLLFYTDGSTVYTKNHVVMANGNGLFGDASSSQSAIIVPKPKDENIYFIFTVDNELDGRNDGLNYSVVDISKNAGFGEVVQKNVNLLDYCTEKITAVRKDCATGSFWLITFASLSGQAGPFTTYHAFEINEMGVMPTSVKSTFTLGPNGVGVGDIRGYMVLSPDGKKMASANMTDGLYIYDFDDSSGLLSNQINLTVSGIANKPYGLAFSPNNELLYVHSSNDYFARDSSVNDPQNHFSTLSQFDLSSQNIQGSKIVIDERNLYRGALQLGPDGRIYRALSQTYSRGYSYLGTINNPNARGSSANYVHNSISIAPNESAQGLPPFIQSFFNEEVDIINDGSGGINLAICQGESYTLRTRAVDNATFMWTMDGNLLNETDQDLVVDQAGHYTLTITPDNGDCAIEGQAYVEINPLPQTSDYDLVQCDVDGQDDGVSLFNLNEATQAMSNYEENRKVEFFKSYEDALASGTPLNNEYRNDSNPEFLYARVIDTRTSCSSISKLTLSVIVTNTQDAFLKACDDDGIEDGVHRFDLAEAESILVNNSSGELEITYYQNVDDALLEMNALSTDYINDIPYEQVIYVRIENENQCFGINRIHLAVNPLPALKNEDSYIYCLNYYPETITINSGILDDKEDHYSYEWSTGEIEESIKINEIGTYKVLVTNEFGCSKERVVTVLPSNVATITDIDVVDVTNNNSITVTVTGEGNYEYSLDDEYGLYQDSNAFERVEAGIHTLYVRDKNECGTISTKVSVIGFPKIFTPNNDGVNDFWKVKGVSAQFQPKTVIYIYDRFGKLLKQLNPLQKGWDGTFNGEPLVSTDYWFSVLLEDGRTVKGHFSLRR